MSSCGQVACIIARCPPPCPPGGSGKSVDQPFHLCHPALTFPIFQGVQALFNYFLHWRKASTWPGQKSALNGFSALGLSQKWPSHFCDQFTPRRAQGLWAIGTQTPLLQGKQCFRPRTRRGQKRIKLDSCLPAQTLQGLLERQRRFAPENRHQAGHSPSGLLLVAEVADRRRVIPPVRPQRAIARRGPRIFTKPGGQSPPGSRFCSAKPLTPTSGGGASRPRTGTGPGARSWFTPRSRSSGWTPGYPASSL